ncbi:MAG: zinc ribbon domain-containing protein [Anaerolineaceae bacterium]|nr:zinc ribbon domain-containing protein [Anaerolineaceae bacterium]
MQRLLIAFLILFALMTPGYVQAQDIVEIERMQIDIWPEFDRPDALILYRFTLTDSTSLPAKLIMRIPVSSGDPYNLAMRDTDGMLYILEYSTSENGDWLDISFSTPTPEVQLEYYDPNLEFNGDHRSFEYIWPGDYTVHSMTVQVQQPLNASEMLIEPDFGAGQLQQDGLMYYQSLFGEVEAGITFDISLDYNKPDDTLSSSFDTVSPMEPITEQTSGRTSFKVILPYALGGLGLVMIAGVAFWYLQSQRVETKYIHKRAKPEAHQRHKTQTPGNVYCHQCGTRAQPDDDFCRSCGTKLRTI